MSTFQAYLQNYIVWFCEKNAPQPAKSNTGPTYQKLKIS